MQNTTGRDWRGRMSKRVSQRVFVTVNREGQVLDRLELEVRPDLFSRLSKASWWRVYRIKKKPGESA